MFLMDTNVVSELRKPRPHGGVLAWARNTPQAGLFISAITLMELQDGAHATRKQDSKKADEIEAWIGALEDTFAILPLDAKSARVTSDLLFGRSRNLSEDAMIAAIAMTHGLTVATRNVKDFQHFNVPVENPFQYVG